MRTKRPARRTPARSSPAKSQPARKEAVKKELARSVLIAIGLIIAAIVALKALNYLFPDLFAGIQATVAAYGLFGAFIVVLLGSSLAPFPTDAFFVSAVTLSPEPALFVAVAMVAAFLGGFVNYTLAYYLSDRWVEKQVGRSVLAEAKGWFDHWGPFAIFFFGVLPISAIIDPLTFVAGLARMDVKTFALYSAAARIVHFGALALIALGLLQF